jgi:hypothetical protein
LKHENLKVADYIKGLSDVLIGQKIMSIFFIVSYSMSSPQESIVLYS